MENEIGYNITVSQRGELGRSLEKQRGCSLYVRMGSRAGGKEGKTK